MDEQVLTLDGAREAIARIVIRAQAELPSDDWFELLSWMTEYSAEVFNGEREP